MACSDSSVLEIIDENAIKSIRSGVICVSIPSNIEYIYNGTETASAFKGSSSTLVSIDFSSAINLKAIGSCSFYSCSSIQEFDLSACTKLDEIGWGAFYDCSAASSIILPNSTLKTIPGSCFGYCLKLKTMAIPSNIEEFAGDFPVDYGVFINCKSLETVTFSSDSKLRIIGKKVFVSCALKRIVLPKTVQSINGWTFRICSNLEAVEVEAGNSYFYSNGGVLYSGTSLVYYPQKASKDTSVIISSSVTAINQYSFVGVGSYKQITIPSSVTSIQSQAFFGFTSLQNVTFKNSMTTLPNGCFIKCPGLTEFHIPYGMITLGNGAFESCSNLADVYIPKTVKEFKSGVFTGCSPDLELHFENDSDVVYLNGFLYNKELNRIIIYLGDAKTIRIISSIKTISNGAFHSRIIESVEFDNIQNITSIENYAFTNCAFLTSIQIPKITTISSYCFQSCTKLDSVTIPSTVKNINDFAFKGCTGLKTISFSTTLTSIGWSSFESCTSLKTINFPDSLSSISKTAFYKCYLLETINIPKSLSSVGEKAFALCGIKNLDFPPEFSMNILTRMCFYQLQSLKSLSIPTSAEQLCDNSFGSCTSLETITLSGKLSQIDDYAFSGCTQLINVTIIDCHELTSFSYLSFDNCQKLVLFNVNDYANNFYFSNGILFDHEKTKIILFLGASQPTLIIIPSKVVSINNYAFYKGTSIQKVIIEGNSIGTLGISSFECCTSLQSINFPSSIYSIGMRSFESCNLSSVTLERTSLSEISSSAFSNNLNLYQITLPSTLVKCAPNAFSNVRRNAIVFYFGTNVISNAAGFSRKAKAICIDSYPSNSFLALPASRGNNIICSCQYRRNRTAPKIYLFIATVSLYFS